MKFTIITAAFNCEKTINRTLESLLKQTNLNFEYIIIDGNSTDETLKIIKSYEEEFNNKAIPFSWVSEEDSGIYDAWNKGLKLANGDWVSFLGSDDYYLENALETYDKLLSNNSEDLDWVYSNVRFEGENNNSRVLDSVWSWKQFRRNINITPAHVGSFHNKQYFKNHGVFDVSYKIAGDYEMLLRAKDKLRTNKAEKITAVMSSGGVSNNMIRKVFKETFRAKRSTGEVGYLLCVFDYYLSLIIYFLKKTLKN